MQLLLTYYNPSRFETKRYQYSKVEFDPLYRLINICLFPMCSITNMTITKKFQQNNEFVKDFHI